MKTPRMVLIAIVSLALLPAGAGAVLAETRMEESRRLEPGGQFVLDADAGSVELVGTAKSGARIVITSKDDKLAENFDIKIEQSAGMVKVTAKKKGSGLALLGQRPGPELQDRGPDEHRAAARNRRGAPGDRVDPRSRGPADLRRPHRRREPRRQARRRHLGRPHQPQGDHRRLERRDLRGATSRRRN